MTYISVLYIAVFWVLIIDVTGFVEEVKHKIFKWLNGGKYRDFALKPFDCSLCMTWWTCLVVMLCTGWNFPLLIFATLVACFTPIIKDIILMVRDMFSWMINNFWDIFQ